MNNQAGRQTIFAADEIMCTFITCAIAHCVYFVAYFYRALWKLAATLPKPFREI